MGFIPFIFLLVLTSFAIIEGLGIPTQYSINDDYLNLQSKEVPTGYVDGALCNRECNGTPMNCFFNFELETYYTMSIACFDCPRNVSDCSRKDCIVAGGISRLVTVINRQMPGPSIEVCHGDKIIVLLSNELENHESTTLHWHGLHMIRNKYMDGAPFVTQCPILKNNNFTYEFRADNVGTFWWHSHIDSQRGDGVYGALIIRQPKPREGHKHLYDFDLSSHVIQLTDWNDRPRLDVFEGFVHAGKSSTPTGLLVNGLGYQSRSGTRNTPMANFVVKSGYRYRFRLINVAFFQCPMEISIDGHKMFVISSDGDDFEPIEVDSFMSASGERFDFILKADQPKSTYYIRVKGQSTCAFSKAFTAAILTYEGSLIMIPNEPFPTYETSSPGGVVFNPISMKRATNFSKAISFHEAKSLQSLPSDLNLPGDSENVYKFYIAVGMNYVENPEFHRSPYYGFDQIKPNQRMPTAQFNRISNKFYGVPYLQGRFMINSDDFCNDQTMSYSECSEKFCT